MHKTVSLIAAMGNKREIGFEGRMPWHLPAELQHFKQETMGRSIVMGRLTWQAIGRPLPGRQNIVISRNPSFGAAGADVCTSLACAINISRSAEVMVIGGGQLYAMALPHAQRMILTLIDIQPQADTWFPEWNERQWRQVDERCFPAGDNNSPAYRIVKFARLASDSSVSSI